MASTREKIEEFLFDTYLSDLQDPNPLIRIQAFSLYDKRMKELEKKYS
jgi:hypothetical protein